MITYYHTKMAVYYHPKHRNHHVNLVKCAMRFSHPVYTVFHHQPKAGHTRYYFPKRFNVHIN